MPARSRSPRACRPGATRPGVLHDENRSGDMDKGFGGVPLEGYGVTNNPKPRLRKATFQEATFTLPADGRNQDDQPSVLLKPGILRPGVRSVRQAVAQRSLATPGWNHV